MRLIVVLLSLIGCRPTGLSVDDDDRDPADSVDVVPSDDDGDGSYSDEDCDDDDASVFPGADEACNGVDDDCDGEVDDGAALELWPDDDGDGWGTGDVTVSCDAIEGWATAGGDCDDADTAIHPEAEDACDDGIDSDCDPRDLQCSLEGSYGTGTADAKVYATQANDMTGEYMDVGDLNADGYDDVAVTTFYRNSYAGGAAVIYGPVSGEVTVDDAGDRLVSTASTTSAGRSIAVGDLNADGVDDLVLGAPDDTCRVWVNFGPFDGDRGLVDSDVTYTGRANTEVGHGSDVADINGDGVADLIVGAYEASVGGRLAGAIYVKYGPLEAGTAAIEDSADVTLNGESRGAYAGRYVHAGGDVDGDGIEDLLIAAPYASDGAPQSGVAYLVYGGLAGDLDLENADARYMGEDSGEYAGEALSLGDVDGDGLADVLLGSFSSAGGYYAGAAYVVVGPGTHVESLGDADLVIRGDSYAQQFGLSLSGADLDGDGGGELLVGARGDSVGSSSGGAAYLFWGPVRGVSSPGDADVAFVGEDVGAAVGYAVGLGDLDGNGSGDILLGAPSDAQGGSAAGALFVFYTGE